MAMIKSAMATWPSGSDVNLQKVGCRFESTWALSNEYIYIITIIIIIIIIMMFSVRMHV